jgi:hypothetical protein
MPDSVDPSKAEATGTFRTGFRAATVSFDSIHVRHDSSGDLFFQFGVGNADTHSLLGQDSFKTDDNVDDGEDVAVNKDVTISAAPRVLWAQVTCDEDDNTFWTALTYGAFDGGVSLLCFAPPGSRDSDGETWSVQM